MGLFGKKIERKWYTIKELTAMVDSTCSQLGIPQRISDYNSARRDIRMTLDLDGYLMNEGCRIPSDVHYKLIVSAHEYENKGCHSFVVTLNRYKDTDQKDFMGSCNPFFRSKQFKSLKKNGLDMMFTETGIGLGSVWECTYFETPDSTKTVLESNKSAVPVIEDFFSNM